MRESEEPTPRDDSALSSEQIPLRTVFPEFNAATAKLHCASWNGTEHPLDVFVRSRAEWAEWNSWRSTKNEFNRPFIFSLIQFYREPNRWLFGGIFEILGRSDTPNAHSYVLGAGDGNSQALVGRLKVAFERPGRNRSLRLERYFDQMDIAEILPNSYSGQPFPGHDSVDHTFREIETIFRQSRLDWKTALEFMKGVYVLHDRATGMAYVGSAYGDTGIWARWRSYTESGHGGNVALRMLIDREGLEYVRQNLKFALLECWSMRVGDEYVLARECYWKSVLMSRDFGHNRN